MKLRYFKIIKKITEIELDSISSLSNYREMLLKKHNIKLVTVPCFIVKINNKYEIFDGEEAIFNLEKILSTT